MERDGLSFHDVAELRADHGDGGGGSRLQRVPESVRDHLNDGARERMLMPEGCEIRLVPESASATVTLSSEGGDAKVLPFWGPFQGNAPVEVGAEPTRVEVTPPERLETLDPEVADSLPFSPAVCRLRPYSPGTPYRADRLYYHGVEGAVRPPEEAELPDRRLLAYGTSITEGVGATAPHLHHVSQTARRIDADPVNLGSGGSAHCEPELADYVAERDDWDVAVLSLSVNMLEFSLEEFRERTAYMVDRVAGANPDRPVAAVTLYPFFGDVCPGSEEETWGGSAEAFRDALREAVADCEREDVELYEGPDLLDPAGLTADLIHPGDDGMVTIGERLAERLRPRL